LFEIKRKTELSPDICRFEIEAAQIAKKRKPGQFVIIRVTDTGERVPLTIADADVEAGTITLIAQGVGKTTKMLNMLEQGDSLHDVVGPLGSPTHIENFGTVVIIGGGVGIAIAYPIAKGMHLAGNKVVSILGARNKSLMMLEDEVREISDEVIITTDDGSYGIHGFVTEALKKLIDEGRKIDVVVAIGPVVMMQAIAELTRPHGIHTIVSLNPIMIDGTGMCGGCRVSVGGQIKFACVDGPEFDAHQVDFDDLKVRLSAFRKYEQDALERWGHECRIKEQEG
jgi:NAD(P)H-flavin reductase